MRRVRPLIALAFLGLIAPAFGQDRDTKVRRDFDTFGDDAGWVYNDLESGLALAKSTGKPLMIVFRCIPCEACQEFDDDVARRDPIVRDMMDRFVCVRVVQANTLDLTRFQHDFDQSFAVALMNADGTLYGRFGTRSNRKEEEKDISLEGLRLAMEGALRLHADYDAVKPTLAGKQVKSARFPTPRQYPSLAGKYGTSLDYAGAVAKSCLHCHQVGEAERRYFRDRGEPIPDEVLFPYPNPSVLGLTMDPKRMATVAEVAPGSTAERDGFRAGDSIESLEGQPMLSIADLQWVLHNAPAEGRLSAAVERDGERRELPLTLEPGWRRRAQIDWRTTTWDLRRMAFGGLVLEPLPEADRETLNIPDGKTALRVKHVGQFGDHAVAKAAGVKVGDVVISYDGRNDLTREAELIAHAVQRRKPGEQVTLGLIRDGERVEVTISLQ